MPDDAVRVVGLKELLKAFAETDRKTSRELRDELRKGGRVVQEHAARLFSRVSPRSAGGYRVVVRQRGVSVEQSLRRTTGLHPDFGALQMRTALLPAVERNQDAIVKSVENMLDRVSQQQGF